MQTLAAFPDGEHDVEPGVHESVQHSCAAVITCCSAASSAVADAAL